MFAAHMFGDSTVRHDLLSNRTLAVLGMRLDLKRVMIHPSLQWSSGKPGGEKRVNAAAGTGV